MGCIFFDNKEETYNTCWGTYVHSFERDGNEIQRAFGYQMCKNCTVCDIHKFAPNINHYI